MDPGEFCAACGRTGVALTDGICAECAAERTVLVRAPARAIVVLCPTCGARGVGAHWERAGSARVLTGEDLTPRLEPDPEVGIRSVTWEEVGASGNLRQYLARARIRFRGLERELSIPLEVKTEFRSCPECSRKSGRYYTAQIQLRGEVDGPREKAAALRARLEERFAVVLREARADWRKAISWREALPEGWDYFVVDTLAARSLARLARQRLGANVKESATLVGRKDGQDLYRVTICLRVPPGAPEAAPARASRGRR